MLSKRLKQISTLSLLAALAAPAMPLSALAIPARHGVDHINGSIKIADATGGAQSPAVSASSIDSDLNQPMSADLDSQSSSTTTTDTHSPQSESGEKQSDTSSNSESEAVKSVGSGEQTQGANISAPTKGRFNLPANGFLSGGEVLKATVTEDSSKSPILRGAVQTLPTGTKVSMIANCYLNSQISQKGEEVTFRIAQDVRDGKGGRVMVPGDWVAHGFITEAVKPGRNGVPGRVDVRINRIVSPDGNYELPFECKISSADDKIKAVSKLVLRDAKFVSYGALAGSVLSVQMTGMGTAIATHGISVGIGAAAGATFGAICAAWRKGNIAALSPNDELRLVTSEPIDLPGFNPVNLPSAAPKKTLEGLMVAVNEHRFEKDGFTGDKSSRLLYVTFSVVNNSNHSIEKNMLEVVSAKGVHYPLDLRSIRHSFSVPSKGEKTDTLCFNVDSPKNKYYLVLLDSKRDEFKRVPIN